MPRSRTEWIIDKVAIWSAIAVYFAVWIIALTANFQAEGHFAGIGVATVYVAMHIFEITVRHHCFLSADPTAIPVTLLVFFVGWAIAHFTIRTDGVFFISFFIRGCVAWMLAHFLAPFYAITLTAVVGLCFWHRIKSERTQGAPDSR